MRSVIVSIIVTLLLSLSLPATAEQQPEETLKAIVQVRATIPDNARTAPSLGTKREGSGTVIDSNGLVLTIGYLILEADGIEVVSSDGEVVPATFVAYDDNTGFGLLRADRSLEVTPIKLGQSSEVKVGDQALVATFGGPDTMLATTVVSRDEFVGYWEYLLEDAIYTVPSHPNYGGAALLGRHGRLLGVGSILTQFMIQGVGTVSSNMFVPIDYLKPILSDLIAKGHSSEPRKPYLGFHAEESRNRVYVIRIQAGGPAEKAGLRVGDIVLKVNKRSVEGLSDFYRKVWRLGRAGVDVPLSVLQGSEILEITIHSSDRYKHLRLHPQRKADYVEHFELPLGGEEGMSQRERL